jgi:hypothetical protein
MGPGAGGDGSSGGGEGLCGGIEMGPRRRAGGLRVGGLSNARSRAERPRGRPSAGTSTGVPEKEAGEEGPPTSAR